MAGEREKAAAPEPPAAPTSKKQRGLGPLAKLAWQPPSRGLVPAGGRAPAAREVSEQRVAAPVAAESAPPPVGSAVETESAEASAGPEERARERRRAGGRSRGSRPPVTVTAPSEGEPREASRAPAGPSAGSTRPPGAAGPGSPGVGTSAVSEALLQQLRLELSALIELCEEPPAQLATDMGRTAASKS